MSKTKPIISIPNSNEDSRHYEQFDTIPTIYDNHNIHLSSSSSSSESTSSSSSSSISPPPIPQTLPPANLENLSEENKRNSNSNQINNRLFFNFNHKTSSLNQKYLNSIESSPKISYHTNNRKLKEENVENNLICNNKPVVLRMSKDTANLFTENVNVCGSKHGDSSSRLINDSKEVICSPITVLKHKDSFMKRIFSRPKSKDKFSHLKQVISSSSSSNSSCAYASMNDSNGDGSHYNLASVGRKVSKNLKNSGKKC